MADETIPFAQERLNELCSQALLQDQEATIIKLRKETLALNEKIDEIENKHRKSKEIQQDLELKLHYQASTLNQ